MARLQEKRSCFLAGIMTQLSPLRGRAQLAEEQQFPSFFPFQVFLKGVFSIDQVKKFQLQNGPFKKKVVKWLKKNQVPFEI